MTTRWITLLLLTGALTFAVGCPEDDDDSAGDDDAGDDDGGDDDGGDDDGGDDDGGDDDGGDDDTDPVVFAGDHVGGVAGDGHGLFDATVATDGALDLDGEVGSGEAMTGTGVVLHDGTTTISVTIDVQPKKSLVECTGAMREQGGQQFGYGDWTSSEKDAGVWATWPTDFALGIPSQDIEAACAASNKYCGAPVMTAKDCIAVSTCQGGFMVAASADCATVYDDFMQLFLTMDGPEDCPDFGKPLPEWVKHDCPDVFSACGMLLP